MRGLADIYLDRRKKHLHLVFLFHHKPTEVELGDIAGSLESHLAAETGKRISRRTVRVKRDNMNTYCFIPEDFDPQQRYFVRPIANEISVFDGLNTQNPNHLETFYRKMRRLVQKSA